MLWMARAVQSIITRHKLIEQPIVVTDKGGGSGAEGYTYTKVMAGDPYKLVFGTSNAWTQPMVSKGAYNYTDLTPIAAMVQDEFLLWVKQDGPYQNVQEYLKAVAAAGTTDADPVMATLKKTKINDMFTKGGYVRGDGAMIHDMYVMQVKSPQESKYPWDYYKVVKVMSGEEAFGPITGLCPLAPK